MVVSITASNDAKAIFGTHQFGIHLRANRRPWIAYNKYTYIILPVSIWCVDDSESGGVQNANKAPYAKKQNDDAKYNKN